VTLALRLRSPRAALGIAQQGGWGFVAHGYVSSAVFQTHLSDNAAMAKLSKIMFAPFAALGGLLAGVLGKKVFRALWGLIDSEPPPDPDSRDAAWPKVVTALALEGAVFRATRGVVDRSARELFATLTGVWPGERPGGAQSGADGP
jgi:Protein of unknown function (DUF4235)